MKLLIEDGLDEHMIARVREVANLDTSGEADIEDDQAQYDQEGPQAHFPEQSHTPQQGSSGNISINV